MDFDDQQAKLVERIREGEVRLVYLDPDGTYSDWLTVVIQSPTRVAYAIQCGGVTNDERMCEGYLVPLGGARFDPSDGYLSTAPFREVFHRGTGCFYASAGDLPADRLNQLRALVRDVPYWRHSYHSLVSDTGTSRDHLEIDDRRLGEICEAWVPVRTLDGDGVLLFKNCD